MVRGDSASPTSANRRREASPARGTTTTILFDVGGTLAFPSFGRIAAALSAAGHPIDAAALTHADARIRREMDRPDVITATTDGERFRRYLEALGRVAGAEPLPARVFDELDAYHRVHNLWEDVPPEVPRALEDLRGRFRLGVVSNANGTVRAKLERVGLAGFFEVIVDSHDEGIEKPDPRIFHLALRRMGVKAAEAAYVGDLYHVDVVGAAAAGLRPFLLDPFGLHGERPVARLRALDELAAALAG
jgi:putative hydrolase of the HAD superfamily